MDMTILNPNSQRFTMRRRISRKVLASSSKKTNGTSSENARKGKERDSEEFDEIDEIDDLDGEQDQAPSDEEESYNPTGPTKPKKSNADTTANGKGKATTKKAAAAAAEPRQPKKRGRKPKDKTLKDASAKPEKQPKVGSKRTKEQQKAIICIDVNEKDPKKDEGENENASMEEISNGAQIKDINFLNQINGGVSASVEANEVVEQVEQVEPVVEAVEALEADVKSVNSNDQGYKIQKTDGKSQESIKQNEGGEREEPTQ